MVQERDLLTAVDARVETPDVGGLCESSVGEYLREPIGVGIIARVG